MVAAYLPDHRVDSVVPVGEGGDHLAYEVDGELIVRFGKEPDPAARAAGVDREARLLAAVAAISPLPVPEPVFTAAEQGCLAYRKLPGVPLLDLPLPPRSPGRCRRCTGDPWRRSWGRHRRPAGGGRCSPTTISGSSMSWSTPPPGR